MTLTLGKAKKKWVGNKLARQRSWGSEKDAFLGIPR